MAFDIKENDTKTSPGHSYLDRDLIFDVKMNFTRKARFVANESTNPTTSPITYAGLLSRDTVQIAFTYTTLNGLDIMSADKNAYLQALISENYWTILSLEFGPELKLCKAYVVRELYGTHCDGRDFRQYLLECMEMLGYTSCLANPNLWIRKAVNDDGCEYYE